MERLLKRFYPGKAFVDDCISDAIFSKVHRCQVIRILRDLWSGQDIKDFHFRARLVALNKKHPEIPRPDQIRPIIVTSPLVKILEGRLVEKLQSYLRSRLHVSQVGFVDEMDIYVNLWRALEILKRLREGKKRVFCLFLDFSSAYNTVPHNLLFERLKDVLSPEEIQLIQAIYSRTVVCQGDEKFRPNVGVAQGSVISPCLFNIYAEPLLYKLQDEGWRVEDLLGFADDHLVLCLTKGTLRKAINVVKEWCISANIKLNPDKSGILEVLPKGESASLEIGKRFEDVPVVEEYKYLGLVLDNKLDGSRHIEKLFGYKDKEGKKRKGKIDFLKYNLNPLIRNISMDYRTNLWQILIRPLFIPIALLSSFLCQTTINSIERKLRKSIKWFLGLSRNTPNETVSALVKVDLREWASVEVSRAKLKWEARVKRSSVGSLPKYRIECKLRRIPKELATFINLQNVFCRECRSVLSAKHYHYHGVTVPDVGSLLVEIGRKIVEESRKTSDEITREAALQLVAELISTHIEKMLGYAKRQMAIRPK